jgi:DNA polymerase-3 subunit epsilon
MNTDRIAFVDIETTGSSAISDRILEIAIICVDNNKVTKELNMLLNPQQPFSPFIEMMTGIQPSDVTNAPIFEDVQHEIYELLEDRLFVAHNVGFDYGFIKYEFKRLGLSFNADRCCTVKLSRHFFPQYKRHNLDSLIERFEFSCDSRHRAYSDTSVLWQFYQHLHTLYPPDVIKEAIIQISKRPSLPPHIDKTVVDSLPEKPGVYVFYGEQDLPLYVGKSKNIKDRVWSHFVNINDSEKERAITQQLKRIEYFETAGELGALLLESKMVKDMQPVYNRRLRRYDDIAYVVKEKNKDGYFIPVIKTANSKEDVDITTVLAVTKSKAQAKKLLENIQYEHSLCRVLLGLEKSSSGCFQYKLEKCRGACVKAEPPEEYNTRFEEGFAKTAIKPWPYQKPVIIHEVDIENRAGENYIFHNWQYLGTIKYDEETTAFSSNPEKVFDYDMYMILKNYLHSNPRIKEIPLQELEKIQEML